MAPKQRQVRIEQRGAFEAIQALEQRSDEELEAETKYKSAALAILGGRAAQRFDAEDARGHLQRAPRSACSSGAWPTRRWRWPNAGRATSRTQSSALGRPRPAAASCSRCARWACSSPPDPQGGVGEFQRYGL